VVGELRVGEHCTFLFLFSGGAAVRKHQREAEGVIKSKGVTKELVTGVWSCGASAVK
jgi:hypothetical protein